jgi:diguanylate cyclase (GGDEF)-like protein
VPTINEKIHDYSNQKGETYGCFIDLTCIGLHRPIQTIMNIVARQHIITRVSIFIFGLALSFSIFIIDYKILGTEVTFTLLYLIPIVTVTWFSGLKFGMAVSLFSISEWLILKVHSEESADVLLFTIDTLSKLLVFIFIVIILSVLKTRIEKEKIHSTHDHLTGVLNRNGFYEILDNEIYRARRSNDPLTLAYLDIDNFKYINDHLGHHVGDEVLKQLTAMVQSIIRKTDVHGRLGGDEFVILFPDTSIRDSRSVIKKIKSEFSKITFRKKWPISLSIGVGVFRGNSLDAKKMMTTADSLMYKVKKGTKNGAIFHEYD